MQAINRIAGQGGTYNWASTSAYTSGAGSKRAVYAIVFDTDNEVDALEIDGVNVLADYGFTAGDAVVAGTVIFAEANKAFTKITLGVAAQATFYRV